MKVLATPVVKHRITIDGVDCGVWDRKDEWRGFICLTNVQWGQLIVKGSDDFIDLLFKDIFNFDRKADVYEINIVEMPTKLSDYVEKVKANGSENERDNDSAIT